MYNFNSIGHSLRKYKSVGHSLRKPIRQTDEHISMDLKQSESDRSENYKYICNKKPDSSKCIIKKPTKTCAPIFCFLFVLVLSLEQLIFRFLGWAISISQKIRWFAEQKSGSEEFMFLFFDKLQTDRAIPTEKKIMQSNSQIY